MMPAFSNDPMHLQQQSQQHPRQQPQQPQSTPASTTDSAAEQLLLEAFSKFKAADGQTLDISSSMHDMALILNPANQTNELKKFIHIGEAAAQFAVACLLLKQYPDLNITILKALTKKYQCSLSQVYRLTRKQLAITPLLKASSPQNDMIASMHAMMGVLYMHHGSKAVEWVLNDSLIALSDQDLNKNLPIKVKNVILNQELNALSKFHALVQSCQGNAEYSYSSLPNQSWHCALKFRLGPTARTFTHQAMGNSKGSSKSAAARQIMELINQAPDALQELQRAAAPEEQDKVYTLPIQLSAGLKYALQQQQRQQQQESESPDLVKTESQNTVFTDQASLATTPAPGPAFLNANIMQPSVKTEPIETNGNWQHDPNNNRFYIGNNTDEETIRLMSELILGSGSMNNIAARTGDVAMEVDDKVINHNNKRVRTTRGADFSFNANESE